MVTQQIKQKDLMDKNLKKMEAEAEQFSNSAISFVSTFQL